MAATAGDTIEIRADDPTDTVGIYSPYTPLDRKALELPRPHQTTPLKKRNDFNEIGEL
jgi:hypothetical protein